MKRNPITRERYQAMEQTVREREQDKVIRNSILNVGLDESALDHDAKTKQQHTFSLEIKTGKITSQEKSGRCWLFAGLNTLRLPVMRKLNLDNFELSQSYAMFFDKLEKANYFLENILETLDEPVDSRLIMWLMKTPVQDGGQWDMFTAFVEKYGVVPKSVMPETYHSSNSARMNEILTLTLRGFAKELRDASDAGKDMMVLKSMKEEQLPEFYRMLTFFLGVPPTRFDFEYVDKTKTFHRDADCTPKRFYNTYVKVKLTDYISVINAPTKDKRFDRTFTFQYLGNVEGAAPVKYLNLDIKTFKELALKQLGDNEPVWFGSDVGKKMKREAGILDEKIYDYERALDTAFKLEKAGRMDYGESLMTHAMVLTGVNLVDGKPNRWKVENSWGEKNGKDGYFVMSDDWFEQYVYQIVINKKYLSEAQRKAWDSEPIVLKPWDPMGSLAIDS